MIIILCYTRIVWYSLVAVISPVFSHRNNSISLRLKYGTVEKARDVMSLDFKKGQLAMKKRKKMYKRELVQYKQLQEVRPSASL